MVPRGFSHKKPVVSSRLAVSWLNSVRAVCVRAVCVRCVLAYNAGITLCWHLPQGSATRLTPEPPKSSLSLSLSLTLSFAYSLSASLFLFYPPSLSFFKFVLSFFFVFSLSLSIIPPSIISVFHCVHCPL